MFINILSINYRRQCHEFPSLIKTYDFRRVFFRMKIVSNAVRCGYKSGEAELLNVGCTPCMRNKCVFRGMVLLFHPFQVKKSRSLLWCCSLGRILNTSKMVFLWGEKNQRRKRRRRRIPLRRHQSVNSPFEEALLFWQWATKHLLSNTEPFHGTQVKITLVKSTCPICPIKNQA